MPVILQLKSVKPPTVKVVPGSADLEGVGHVEVYVMNPNKTTELAFTIGVVRMYIILNIQFQQHAISEESDSLVPRLLPSFSSRRPNAGNRPRINWRVCE